MLNLFSLLAINTETVLLSLDIMWKGVLAIFIVIILIVVSVTLLNKIVNYFEKKNKDK
ncbi:MAG: hypothetical protein IJW26_03660 [Clostridia bacterium]|nr:hypothetical protein [Clostridia bacterium]